MAESNARVTWEGCSVLLDINDGDRLVFARLSPNASIKIGNKKCSLNPLVGCPFGSLFRVESGPGGPHLARCVPSLSADATCKQEKDDCQSKDEARDNRELIDNNTAQGLSSEDIDAMRREGATGDDIVDALIANSSTFGKKTAFSQEKYKIKKQKKYAPKVLLRRPFARSICEAYFKKYPTRIGFLRVDTLSLLLSMGNVGAYSDVLVVDMVGGILAGAVAERLGGTGYVCSTYFGTRPYALDIARIFNFSSEVCCSYSSIRRFSIHYGVYLFEALDFLCAAASSVLYSHRILQAPFSDLCPSGNIGNASSANASSELHENVQSSELQSNANDTSLSPDCIPFGGSIHMSEADQEVCARDNTGETLSSGHAAIGTMGIHPCSSSRIDGTRESNASSVQKSITPGRLASTEDIKSWKEKGFTSLIVAAPEMDVETIVQDLLPLLSYSAPFVIYHQYLQPLAACMHKLQCSKMAIGLQISEPWLREYQVLPSRTHPHMQMSGFGGYILSGTRLFSTEACNGK